MTEVHETPEELRWRVLALLVPHLCHKVNNAIGVVQGLSEILMGRPHDPRDHKQLSAVFQQANQIARLVSGVGEYAARSEASHEFVDLAGVVRTAECIVAPLFRDTGGRLDARIGEGTFVCRTNPRRLTQLLVILAAAPYTAPRRTGLSCSDAPARVRLTLSRKTDEIVLCTTRSDRGPEREAEAALTLECEFQGIGANVVDRACRGWRTHRFVFPGAAAGP